MAMRSSKEWADIQGGGERILHMKTNKIQLFVYGRLPGLRTHLDIFLDNLHLQSEKLGQIKSIE